MSQAFMESFFPLAFHEHANTIRKGVDLSLYGENANSSTGQWDEDALFYTRSSWSKLKEYLDDSGVELTPEQEARLIDFASEYASLVDEEEDIDELRAMMNEGER